MTDTFAWIMLWAAGVWVLCAVIGLATFGRGPDWTTEACVAVAWVATAVFVLFLVLLVLSAIGVSISFGG